MTAKNKNRSEPVETKTDSFKNELPNISQKISDSAVSISEQMEAYVYLGPTIHGIIQSGTVYSGKNLKDIESFIDAAIKQYPLISKLIVHVNELAESRIKVKTPGNALYTFYHKVISQKSN